MTDTLTYSVVTPARNEARNLRRLAPCMINQTVRPREWLIVDNGSTDETPEIVRDLAAEHPWISLLGVPGEKTPTRGAPVVRAFHAGVDALGNSTADVIVKLDADVSFDDDYFARQLNAFAGDPRLGISAGVCLEPDGHGNWSAARVTRGHVRGAVRAYREKCLEQVTPLEERMGWDGVDELKAQVGGWSTVTVQDLAFYHHRVLGARESKWHKWERQGEMAHFMAYRPSYLLFRAAYHVPTELHAVALLWGYGVAWVRRKPQCAATEALEHLRNQQSVRALPARVREKLGLSV